MAYVKKDWVDEEIITEEALDNMENGIEANDKKNTQQDADIAGLKQKTGNASISTPGIVKQTTKVDEVSAENAGTVGAEFNQVEVQKIATLADANKAAINKIIQVLKTSGIMSNS